MAVKGDSDSMLILALGIAIFMCVFPVRAVVLGLLGAVAFGALGFGAGCAIGFAWWIAGKTYE